MRYRATSVLLVFVCFVSHVNAEDQVLFDSSTPNASRYWQAVNDGVMGGRSVGKFRVNAEDKLEFFGNLSLLNNGGFASVRARFENAKLDSKDKLVARVRGDGREYKFNVYTQSNMGGYSYRQAFKSKKGEWIEVEFPMNKFIATWRGRNYPNQRLDAGQVAGMGFLLGDKNPGAFKLEIDWIKIRRAD